MPTKEITNLQNGYINIYITFTSDELTEGETLIGETQIKGTPEQANDYAEIFIKDLRNTYPEKFPKPETSIHIMEGDNN